MELISLSDAKKADDLRYRQNSLALFISTGGSRRKPPRTEGYKKMRRAKLAFQPLFPGTVEMRTARNAAGLLDVHDPPRKKKTLPWALGEQPGRYIAIACLL